MVNRIKGIKLSSMLTAVDDNFSKKMCLFPFLCVIGKYLHVCKLSVCLKKSCMSSALSLAIALHAKIKLFS